ncbi:putative methyltransferase At1g78140, chloroplastic [Silene latifolia]|uniref:putative methyltransferase At1g78140, chloroplastic n=1 Tax=Silene latifolia TaxID=37657 RepID=UPI003D77C98F
MASITKIVTPVVCRIQRRNPCRSFPIFSFPTVRFPLPPVSLQFAAASSSSVIETTLEYVSTADEINTNNNILGCPICYDSLKWSDDSSLSIETIPGSTLQCNTCKKSYYGNESHIDLTIIGSGSKDYVESMPPVTEFFSAPAMSYIYERGWRQNFGLGGYPGPDREFEMAKEYFKPVLGGNIIDASCGSGVFSRRFAKSGLFSLVVALDYSAAMLRQCLEFVKEDPDFPKEKLTLVRADISRLPFVSGTIDAVHAGAALHCWPSPSSAVAEVSRVLRPGGVFVATTTIADGPFALLPFRNTFREYLQQYSGSRVFLSERELKDLCTTCGLVDFRCTRNGLFVMISATKPAKT